jgi:hypothetical protein
MCLWSPAVTKLIYCFVMTGSLHSSGCSDIS